MNNPFEFKTLAEFLEYFHDEKTCREHFEKIRFANGEYCPHCKHTEIYRFSNGKRFRCRKCREDFTIITKTVFGESKIPLRKWFIAIYLLSTNSKGISSIQLAEKVGCTQRTGWFIDHRLREALKQSGGQLFGDIECDETLLGGKEKNRHASKRKHLGTGGAGKTTVMGMLKRDGELKARVIPMANTAILHSVIRKGIKEGSRLITDQFSGYRGLKGYSHDVVAHNKGVYVIGDAHTNTIEGFWSLFKRAYHGTYHWMSVKHTQRYVDEAVFRFNHKGMTPKQKFSDAVSFVAASEHLGYKELTGKV